MDASPLISEHVVAQNIGIEKCDSYEIHYLCGIDKWSPVEGPIVVYFPETRTAFSSYYIPSPGLADRHSADFEAKARAMNWSNYRFLISKDGIRCNTPHISGLASIVARLVNTDGFERIFQPCHPPFIRWENLRFAEIPVPVGLSDYRDALQKKYANGFVEVKCYEIEQGSIHDVLMKRHHLHWPNKFMEILRRPQVAHAFGYEDVEVDADCLAKHENWIHYSPFQFTGFFHEILCYGGAYSHFDSSSAAIEDARRLAEGVFADFGHDYKDIGLHVCHKPWCHRFFDIAWDNTVIIFSASMRQLTIILASDTD